MSGTPIRVIVVDDEPVIRQFLQVALADMGAHVETFGTCAEGLERCRLVDFDVAFVDKNLPDGTGLQICAALTGADCKVALITGYANLHSAVEAMRHGVADYFIKPLDLDDLEARFQRMTKQLHLERANRSLLANLVAKCRELERLAARDTVTGLFNHTHFQTQLRSEIERSRSKHRFSLALIALDGFSEVNERLGHTEGDRVLRLVADLLLPADGLAGSSVSRKQDLVCRLNGATFALLLPETPIKQAAGVVERFRGALSLARVSKDTLGLTASIGLVEYPTDRSEPSALIDAAGSALRRAKAAGGNCQLCYDRDEASETGVDSGLRRVRALGGCLSRRAVRFVYQPIVSISGRQPFAYEALCRPTDPAFGDIGELLSAAGEAGRLIEFGNLLREVALQPMDRLRADASLFLNVQPQELYGNALFAANSVLHAMAHRIVLEITETEQISDFSSARAQLCKLREVGFRIALDDFGAGYQGLGSLAMLEPDFVKLDMGIVRGITPDSRAGRLTRNMHDFCEDEGIVMIAEGVETESEFQTLHGMGIDLMQGYLFAQPSEPFCEVNWAGTNRRSA